MSVVVVVFAVRNCNLGYFALLNSKMTGIYGGATANAAVVSDMVLCTRYRAQGLRHSASATMNVPVTYLT